MAKASKGILKLEGEVGQDRAGLAEFRQRSTVQSRPRRAPRSDLAADPRSGDPASSAEIRRDGGGPFVPMHVPKTAEVVADHIRKRIIRGELREGDFLPPEAQVMAALAISRPTLREAFRILEAENLISVLRGSRSGARVHQPRVETVARYAGFALQAQGTTVADIYEARLAIEPYAARRLAQTRPAGATERLRMEVGRLRALVDDQRYVDFMIALAEFHRALVELSGVRTLAFLNRMLQEIVTRYQVRFFETNVQPDDEYRRQARFGVRSFERLVELIEAGEADKAEAHWRLHIINANAAWVPKGLETKVIDVFD
jgi:DNA-binding FadR family transcriptional regulator